jgi:hypothetical protein
LCLELWKWANEHPTFISSVITVTKVGFMVMIQKQSNNDQSGRAHNHQEQKRCGRSRVQQTAFHCFFLCEEDCSP